MTAWFGTGHGPERLVQTGIGPVEVQHGPDAIQGERRINLRLLHHRLWRRHEPDLHDHGRPAKGMPNWSGILTDKQFDRILAFLHSVQEP